MLYVFAREEDENENVLYYVTMKPEDVLNKKPMDGTQFARNLLASTAKACVAHIDPETGVLTSVADIEVVVEYDLPYLRSVKDKKVTNNLEELLDYTAFKDAWAAMAKKRVVVKRR